MGKKRMIAVGLMVLGFAFLVAQTEAPPQEKPQTPPPTPTKNIGKVFFPKDFVHSGKDYAKGTYQVVLVEKDSWPYFSVYSQNKELLFEEMAIVKVLERKRPRSTVKGLSRGNEYFSIKLFQGDRAVMAYFLLKSAAPVPAPAAAEEKKEGSA